MIVKIDPSGLRQTSWHEDALRFVAGGVTTVVAGMIARKWGPAVGGLFLAFPAIFPAGSTLIEKHEREKKERKALDGEKRGILAAAADARGAVMGSLGLVGFAAFSWRSIPHFAVYTTLAMATVAWGLISASCWSIRKFRRRIS